MKIIQKSELIHNVEYSLTWHWEGMPGCGFGFSCDENGNLLEPKSEMNEFKLKNYKKCLAGVDLKTGNKLIGPKLEKYEWHYREPAIGECSCGREVSLSGFTNTCSCGADYNSAGQLLASRSQWGEETGESVADILSVDYGPRDFDDDFSH